MTEFIKVAKVDEIGDGERLWREFEEETVIIFNVGGEFYAIADVCSHDGGPLEDGELDGHSVACPRHGACFDIRNGRALSMPATESIPSFETKVEDGYIYVENPDAW